ncbi:FAD-dependent oxidoreductase, partial [Acinetobacter baumannii]
VAHTADGSRHHGEQLLVCCGAWSNRIASLFGEAVPMEARGPQMGVTEPLPYAIGPSIGLSSPIETETLYFRQIKRGNIVFGGGLKGP